MPALPPSTVPMPTRHPGVPAAHPRTDDQRLPSRAARPSRPKPLRSVTATRRLLLEATEEIVSSSLELLGVPNVLVGLLFVGGQPLAHPGQQGREGTHFRLGKRHLGSHTGAPLAPAPAHLERAQAGSSAGVIHARAPACGRPNAHRPPRRPSSRDRLPGHAGHGLGHARQRRASRAHMSEWPTATPGVITVGALGAVAIMISPSRPGWTVPSSSAAP